MKEFFVSTYIIFKEEIRILIRNPFWIFYGLFEPVVYILLFMPFLKGVASAPGFPAESTAQFFVPGLIIMTAMFNSSYSGFGVLELLESGFIERLRVTPVSRHALALGFILQSVAVLNNSKYNYMCCVVIVRLHDKPGRNNFSFDISFSCGSNAFFNIIFHSFYS